MGEKEPTPMKIRISHLKIKEIFKEQVIKEYGPQSQWQKAHKRQAGFFQMFPMPGLSWTLSFNSPMTIVEDLYIKNSSPNPLIEIHRVISY